VNDTLPCRSKSPNDDPCIRARGHKGKHRIAQPKWASVAPDRLQWEGGINTRPDWVMVDDGHMTEADYDTWGRL